MGIDVNIKSKNTDHDSDESSMVVNVTPDDAGDDSNITVNITGKNTNHVSDDDSCMVADLTPEEVEAAIAAGERAANADFAADIARITAERDELANRIEEAEATAVEASEKLARVRADWENYRRRITAERADERTRATEKLVLNVLPAIDDLERAIEHAQTECVSETMFSQFIDGVAAVYTKMLDALAHDGVELIDPIGEQFDPLAHQAVGRVDDTSVYDETVTAVYQKGYRMGGKVIRPAMVVVAYGGNRRESNKNASSSQASDTTGAKADETDKNKDDALSPEAVEKKNKADSSDHSLNGQEKTDGSMDTH